jgi:serine O-acetyltransferase
MGLVERLIYAEKRPVIGKLARQLLLLVGVDVPSVVPIGEGLVVHHRGRGIVVNDRALIGHRVTIYHDVTIGRADVHVRVERSSMEAIHIEHDVILCAGAKILGGPGVTRVGWGTVVGANAVLTRSTGEWEVWAGIPARKIGEREPDGEVTAAAPGPHESSGALTSSSPLDGPTISSPTWTHPQS